MVCPCPPCVKSPEPPHCPSPQLPRPADNNASPPPEDSPPRQANINAENRDYEWDGNFLLLGIACICVAILVILCIYYFYDRVRQREVEHRGVRRLRILRSRGFSMRSSEDRIMASPGEGLRNSMVDALPVFLYGPESSTEGLRCAVCLCEFQEKEKAKLLPTCKHCFHVDCIDMWFHSHSTCPLCRARVDAPHPLSENDVDDKVLLTISSASDHAAAVLIENNSGDCCEEEESEGRAVIDIPTTEN